MPNWKQKTVVITGGSAGLGKAIANDFASVGTTVISLSRSPQQDTDTLIHLQADVTDDESVATAVESIIEKHDRIDVWINCVGVSTRAKFSECTIEEYQRLLEINLISSIRCTMAAMPHLERTSGSVVLMGTLAARTGWRNISPYVVSKHALSGFAHQVRLEKPDNVHSLFVCPGPIRREDAGQRYAAQAEGLDESASDPGAGVKISGIDPKELARKIRVAIENRKPELVTPVKARLLFSILQLSPKLGDWLLRKFS